MIKFTKEEKKRLFDGKEVSPILPYHSFDRHTRELQEGMGRLSISGAQEKYAMVEEGGVLRLTKAGESGRYILKPQTSDRRFYYKEDMPANEHLTMMIAEEVYGIQVAAHGLCEFRNGEKAYITRRFDYKGDGSKYAAEDFASFAGLNNKNRGAEYKYSSLSYEDCAELINKYCIAPQVEILKFFRLLLFNYLICNADAHLKNFTFLDYGHGDYHLSPAYDLLNTNIHIPSSIFALDKGLFKEGTPIYDTTPIGRPMFWEFGKRIGLSERTLEKEIGAFANNETDSWRLIEQSALSPQAKESYLIDYKYRLSTLQ